MEGLAVDTRAARTVGNRQALALVQLAALMERTRGRPEIAVGLIDGPIALDHPDLARERIQVIPGDRSGGCKHSNNPACLHGTLVAGIVHGRRGSASPAICPECTLLIRPIFSDATVGDASSPRAKPLELASSIIELIDAGARIINISAALIDTNRKDERQVIEALDEAGRRGVIVVVAAGNQRFVGTSAFTRHPWVIPVAACDLHGRPLEYSNLGSSIGQRGLSAPGVGIVSLSPAGTSRAFGGTSAAAPLVSGGIALLWSEYPRISAAELRRVVTLASPSMRRAIVPPLFNAQGSYQRLLPTASRGKGVL